ncbi:DNA gyrase subunit A, partial [Clostridium sp.]|uniref:DNA gyrase subunit A n=1 Tax=Clostridium sp. TaxID=1506 RepID=UPI002FC8CB2D
MLNVFNVDFIEEMEKSYLDYSLSVIKDRAIPDIMGCKPIHNRVLYGASLLGLASNGAYKKSARLVGEIIGRLSPHGDTSAYEAMARMSQDWNVRYPLIDMGGNNGSCDGDSPAAMRYTLCRLSKIGEEMLKDLKKDAVDWKPNFSEDEMEPCSMSGFFPNILANGTSGIAVGYSSNFAPHNLKETVSAINATIENSDITIEELVEKYIQGPDFPLGGEIINKKDVVKIYKEGKGGFITRGRYKIEDKGRTIVFYDMPFSAKKSNLIGEIVQCVRDNKIDGISNITDETTTKEFRIAITLKRGFDADVVANKIYAYTRMQQTVSINQNVLLDGEPKQLNLKEIIDQYIIKCLGIIKRKTNFSLNKISDRLHLIEGLLVALEDIDNVITLIKSSSNAKDAILTLRTKYNLSEVQASAIVDMKLKRLTGL